jgi:CRP-like cAMP-binding protein
MPQLTFRPGDLLFQEGEPSTHAYLLERGSVEIVRGYPNAPRPVGTVAAGEVFGEMGLIDDRPRRNTARAATEVQVTVLTRDEFSSLLLSDPQRCLRYLRSLFERLRDLEARLHPEAESAAPREGKTSGKFQLRLYPLSRYAAGILDEGGVEINTFPFRLGRASEARERDAIDLNDIWLLDKAPFNVSRNHAAFDLVEGGRYVVRDRGSQLGTIVNEKLIGGKSLAREAELEEGDNVVILGGRSSPFQFRAVLGRVSS